MEATTIIKIILMVVFFSEVMVFGKFISGMKCFKQGSIMSIAMTFSGTLFLSIALLDIIPQAIANFDIYFDQENRHISSNSNLHSNSNLPLTMIIAMFTFLVIMFIDKILIGHSHDHEYEVSFTNNPKPSSRHIEHEHEMHHQQENENNGKAEGIASEEQHRHSSQSLKQPSAPLSLRPFILQAGMSIHAFFECLAVGLQTTPLGILGLASAIVVHKWAEGLTLGLIYRKENYSRTVRTVMILVQALVNVVGLVVGTIIIDQGNFVMAFFMSISAGTFLYISLAEVLSEQIADMNKKKAVAMVLANMFMTTLVGFEKMSERNAGEN